MTDRQDIEFRPLIEATFLRFAKTEPDLYGNRPTDFSKVEMSTGTQLDEPVYRDELDGKVHHKRVLVTWPDGTKTHNTIGVHMPGPPVLIRGIKETKQMSESITTHHDGFGLNERIEIRASDQDANGVAHQFEFTRVLSMEEMARGRVEGIQTVGYLQFQKGPRNERESTPGITTDALLAVLIHVMQGFQGGPYKSREGAIMLTKLEEVAMWSKKRATDRAKRGVLGFNKA